MRLDYDQRLRARRVGGVLAPVLLLPLAAWVWVAAPPADPGARDASAVAAAVPDPLPTTVPTVSGAPVPPSSVVVSATAADDGSFDVVETVTFAEPTGSVLLRLPPVTAAGAAFEGVVASVVDLRVDPEDAVRDAPTATPARVDLPAAATSVRLTYRWWGTAVTTRPSPPGRALAALAPLADPGEAPVSFRVDGAPVRNIACPLVEGPGLGCAVALDDGLATGTPLGAATALVLVQLDVP